MTSFFNAAQHYADAGISSIPIRPDGSKVPALSEWKTFQQRISTPEERAKHFANGSHIGIVCGKVSGNLSLIDHDEPGLCDLFEQLCSDHGARDLIERLVRVQTPRGGDHLYFRSEEDVPGNLKLARFADGKTRIETRGEGGQAVAPPTPGYRLIRGRPDRPTTITKEEMEFLFSIARMFDLYVQEPTSRPQTKGDGKEGNRPGDAYNKTADCVQLLERHGWRIRYRHGETLGMQRPGKEGHGISATFNHGGSGLFFVFSTNAAPFDSERSYFPFGVYAELEHGGNYQAAASALGKQGYGEPPKSTGADRPKTKPRQEDAGKEDTGQKEIALAHAWAKQVEERFCYVEGDQWWEYEQNYWQYSSAEMTTRSVQEFLEKQKEATPSRVRNVLFLAKSMLGPFKMSAFNAHPNWIPLRNGVFDTETGQILPHDPKHLLTYQLPYDYAPDADCPLWKRCLSEWLISTDKTSCTEWINILQEWYGYCLLPDNTAQLSMFWLGEGGNGKGVAARVLEKMVGSHSCTYIPIDQLHDPYHRAELQGKLVGFANEPDRQSMKKNGSWFKLITGGDDTITARRPTEKVFKFKSVCRVIVICNELPATSDPSRAYFRRICPVDWRYIVPDEKRDEQLDAKMVSELPGIFNWAMEGLNRWKSEGRKFSLPEESRRMLEGYKSEQDNIGRFMLEELSFEDAFARTPAKDIYRAYTTWCTDFGIRQVESETMLGKRLKKSGAVRKVYRHEGQCIRGWEGVQFVSDAEPDNADEM